MNVLLQPIPPLGPFEKWGVNLMGSLLVIRKGHQFIVVIKNHFTKFVKVHALKSLVKQEVAQFLYELIFT